MTSFGLTFFEQRIEYDKEFLKTHTSDEIRFTLEIEQILKRNKKAWHNYLKLAPSYKKQYVGQLTSAKKEITKQNRLKEAIKLLEQNRKLGMK